MLEQVGVEVFELLLGQLDLLERRGNFVEGQVALVVALLNERFELFDIRERDLDSQHWAPSCIGGLTRFLTRIRVRSGTRFVAVGERRTQTR